MSHFTEVKTQIKDLALLDKAAQAHGLEKVKRKIINGFAGGKTEADVVWRVSNRYDVGAVKQQDGTYNLVADWWGTNHTNPNLSQKLMQEYSIQVVLRRAKLMGHSVTKESQKDGSVKLVLQTRR